MKKRIIVIGSTGSIGRQALSVIDSMPEHFSLVALSAHSDEIGLLRAATKAPNASLCLSGKIPVDGKISFKGIHGLDQMIRETPADIVLNGAAGAGGLPVSIAAIESGKLLALANKESVVMAWSLLSAIADTKGAAIIPVDSEHAALFQLISKIGKANIEEIIITASGGAFRDRPLSELSAVNADEAAAHPNWKMGRKISIDSATMANKGLEVIEASRLFGLSAQNVKVLIHPQSLVHALVRGRDGSLYAHASEPDMRVPIQNALTWPLELPCAFGRLELAGKRLDFQHPDPLRYPLLESAYAALKMGEGATIAYNAANEIAVGAFEAGAIGFTEIAGVVFDSICGNWPTVMQDLESIFDVDSRSRTLAKAIIEERQ